jgi:hypothetical protein
MSSMQNAMFDLLSEDQAQRDEELAPTPFVRFWVGQGALSLWAPGFGRRDLKWSEKDLEHGTASVTLPGTQTWDEFFEQVPTYAARIMSCDMPGGYRTAYLITTVDRVPEGDGHAWDVTLVSLSRMLDFPLWPDPLLPPELQISGVYRGIGPGATAWKTAAALNLVRLQSELWSIPVTNPFDPGTWNLLAKAMDPIVINPRRTGVLDTSDWVTTEWCMDSAWDAAVEICKAGDLSMRCDLWLPGDEQPFPEFMTLTEPKLVVDMVPSPRQVRFTGTLVDGAIRQVIHLVDDMWDWITYPILQPGESALDTLAGDPRTAGIPIYRAGQWSPIDKATKTITYPTSSRSTVGGKSPDWVNTIASDLIGSAVSAIGATIGIPGLKLGFLEKMVQNRVLSYHSIEDRALAAEAGRWRLRESFAGSQTTALTLQAAETAKSDRWANRGRISRQIEVTNGAPYWLGRHLRVGWPVAVEHEDGTAEVETLGGVEFTEGGQPVLTLGTPEPSEPGAFALGKIREVAGWVNRLAVQ